MFYSQANICILLSTSAFSSGYIVIQGAIFLCNFTTLKKTKYDYYFIRTVSAALLTFLNKKCHLSAAIFFRKTNVVGKYLTIVIRLLWF